MALKHSYSVIAPVYDALVQKPLDEVRRKSISRIKDTENKHILINGIGTGLDIDHLPEGAKYTATDITPRMLQRAQQRALKTSIDIEFKCADSHELPFETETFDIVIMHLILAVVPNPGLALQEAERVLKTNGSIYILDKFLKPGEFAPVRKTLNLLLRHVATRTDVVFEEVLSTTSNLHVVTDSPALAGGWFRLIELVKRS